MTKRQVCSITDMTNNFLERGCPNDYGPDIWDQVIQTKGRVWFVTNSILCSEGKPSKEEIANILDYINE